jgi:hypothetical protein
METNKISNFLTEIDKIQQRASGNARSAIFCRRAHDAIVNVYFKNTRDEYEVRIGKSSEIADKLITMGATEAIYGRGRTLLQK